MNPFVWSMESSTFHTDQDTKASKALKEFTQWRSSVEKPKPSPRKTWPKWPWQCEQRISQPHGLKPWAAASTASRYLLPQKPTNETLQRWNQHFLPQRYYPRCGGRPRLSSQWHSDSPHGIGKMIEIHSIFKRKLVDGCITTVIDTYIYICIRIHIL